jgi:hypothetical protein
MSATSETSETRIDTSAGKVKAHLYKLSPAHASTDTLTIEEFGTILAISAPMLCEAPDANSNWLMACTVSTNVITFIHKKVDGSTDASVFKDFYLVVWGY